MAPREGVERTVTLPPLCFAQRCIQMTTTLGLSP
jgi:hypothetical protein